jgi:hypothetical protein
VTTPGRADADQPIPEQSRGNIDPGLGLDAATLNREIPRVVPARDARSYDANPVFAELTGKIRVPVIGKVVRAEPVAALYEQRRIHHAGAFPTLEDQMCAFAPDFDRTSAGFSPDRVDALVWAFADLLVEQMRNEGIYEWTRRQAEALVKKTAESSKPSFAIGSVEHMIELQKAGGS